MGNLDGKTVGILGLGQVGGSLAWALKVNRPNIKTAAFDLKPGLMFEARERKIVDQTAPDAAGLIEIADIVVIALPVGDIVEVVTQMAPALKQKELVTDVGSVMRVIVAAAEEAGYTNYVSGHPLAGTEKRGSEAWKGTLFVGSDYFMTATAAADPHSLELLRELIAAAGANSVEVRAIAHDLAFATTSNVPHVLAFCLKRAYDRLSDSGTDKRRFACPSFWGATRVAASDPEMVFQMLWHNREYLAGALRSLASELEIVRGALIKNDPETFRQVLGLYNGRD